MAKKSKAQIIYDALPGSIISGLANLANGELAGADHKDAYWTGTQCTSADARRLQDEGLVKILGSTPWGRGVRSEIKITALGSKVAAL
jgi:hypothetical protein